MRHVCGLLPGSCGLLQNLGFLRHMDTKGKGSARDFSCFRPLVLYNLGVECILARHSDFFLLKNYQLCSSPMVFQNLISTAHMFYPE